VAGDQTARKLHRLGQVNLIAMRRVARIFPGQLAAVGKEQPGATPPSQHCRVPALINLPDLGVGIAYRRCPPSSA